MGAHLENDGGLAVLAVELADFLQDLERGCHGVDRPGECRHYGVADCFHDGTVMPMGDCVEKREMLPDQGIGIEVSEPLVERGRTLQVSEEERHLPDPETFLLIHPL